MCRGRKENQTAMSYEEEPGSEGVKACGRPLGSIAAPAPALACRRSLGTRSNDGLESPQRPIRFVFFFIFLLDGRGMQPK